MRHPISCGTSKILRSLSSAGAVENAPTDQAWEVYMDDNLVSIMESQEESTNVSPG